MDNIKPHPIKNGMVTKAPKKKPLFNIKNMTEKHMKIFEHTDPKKIIFFLYISLLIFLERYTKINENNIVIIIIN